MTILVVLIAAAMLQADSAVITEHDLSVELIPSTHAIRVTDRMTVCPGNGGHLVCALNAEFAVQWAGVSGRQLRFRWAEADEHAELLAELVAPGAALPGTAGLLVIDLPGEIGTQAVVTLRYGGEVFDAPSAATFSREQIADQTSGIISEEGVYLSPASAWYPQQPGCLARYRMEVTSPAGFEVVSEGDITSRTETEGGEGAEGAVVTGFASPFPHEGIHLVAGAFEVRTLEFDAMAVQTYFFPGSEDLAPRYLEASRRYLEMYEAMLGPYPFSKFAVVENFFPSGYGMPSFTLLGSQVIRLPFIVGTSLGHEICHNWWGNSVYVDSERGNWCEGLTTYCADYHYKELESAEAAAEYRRDINRAYTNYVRGENDLPLRDFRERHNSATRAIGYGKSMMVFHMLRRSLGDENFFGALRRIVERYQWRHASWDDLIEVFEEVGGTGLERVAGQWLDHAGAPFIELEGAQRRSTESGWQVVFTLRQSEPLYALEVPVIVSAGEERLDRIVHLERPSENYTIDLPWEPSALSVDPDCHIFRRLHREEIPPVLSQIFGSPDQLIVLPASGDEELLAAYEAIAAALNRNGFAAVARADELSDEELAGSTLIILGGPQDNPLVGRWTGNIPGGTELHAGGFTLAGRDYEGGGQAVVACLRNPLNSRLGAAVLMGTDAAGVSNLGSRLLHYGRYSYLSFSDGNNADKGTWAVESSPLIHHFDED